MSKQQIRAGGTNYWHLNGKVDPISEIVNAGILTTGNVYWVKDINDDDYIEFKDRVGRQFVYTDIQSAIDKCVDDQNDYVMVCPKKDGAAWELTVAIDLNKNKVHLISVGYGRTNTGFTNTITGFGAAVQHDDEFLHVTGTACEVAGFHFAGTGAATAVSPKGTIDNGLLYLNAPDCYVHDCHLSITGSAATAWNKLGKGVISAGSAAASGARFENVNIESITVGAGTPVLFNTGEENKEWQVKDSTFTFWAGNTDHEPIIAGTGAIGMFSIDNCKFININSGTLPVSVVNGDVTATEGVVLIDYCSAVNVTAMGTNDATFVVPTTSGTAVNTMKNPGIGIIGTTKLPTL